MNSLEVWSFVVIPQVHTPAPPVGTRLYLSDVVEIQIPKPYPLQYLMMRHIHLHLPEVPRGVGPTGDSS